MKCVFQVKINSQNEDMLRQACELFMGKKVDEIRNIALETMVSLQITTVLSTFINSRNGSYSDSVCISELRNYCQ